MILVMIQSKFKLLRRDKPESRLTADGDTVTEP